MNTLVVYDSLYGNTEQIAQAIAQTLQEFGTARLQPVAQVTVAELQDVDLLVLGCPTQGWHPTPAMNTFLTGVTATLLSGLDIACFDTRFHLPRFLTGSAAHAMVGQMHKLGGLVLAPPESFFVESKQGPLEEGELQRADGWARALYSRIAEHSPVLHPM
ncbi:MAG: flavodoxin domain-containing protein [Caldilineaceae bacterium]